MRSFTNYAKFYPSFWVKGTGRSLRGKRGLQLLFIYLFTNDRSSQLGIYHISLFHVAHDQGITIDDARQELQLLSEMTPPVIYYDEGAELIYIPTASRWQVGLELKEGDRQRQGLAIEIAPFGEHRFAVMWWERYGAPYKLGAVMPSGRRVGQLSLIDADEAPVLDLSEPTAEPPPPPKKTRAKPEGRGKTALRADWRPNEKGVAMVPPTLDLEVIIDDFRDHWNAQGKMMADWDATFRQNMRKILSTDWLAAKFVKQPTSKRLARATPKGPEGMPVPAPDGIIEELEGQARRLEDFLAEEEKALGKLNG